MPFDDYIAYYRVSSAKQGASGLGLEAQKTAVLGYLKSPHRRIIAEFTEVESGRRDDRPALDQALALARLHRVPIIVAKVDRLTRSVAFLSRLLEAGADVRFADLPALEGPTGRFMLQQMAAVAELEAGLSSSRTRVALAAAKSRGKKLGGSRGANVSNAAREESASVRSRRSGQRALDLAPTLKELSNGGIVSRSGIARALNENGIPTAQGRGLWTTVQVSRVLKSLSQLKAHGTLDGPSRSSAY